MIGAESKKTASIRSAEADRNKLLSETAGSVTRANELAEAIARMKALDADPQASEQDRQAARQQVQTLFFGEASRDIAPVGGKAAETILAARQERVRDQLCVSENRYLNRLQYFFWVPD